MAIIDSKSLLISIPSREDHNYIDYNNPVLELKGLNIYIDGKTLLKNINFSVYKNEFFTIMGDNGTGKTLLIKSILGLHEEYEGKIIWFGKNLNEYNKEELILLRKKIGTAFQNSGLLDSISVIENILFPVRTEIKKTKSYYNIAKEFFKAFGLEGSENKYPQELSGGMQKRVSIIRALIGDPEVCIYDDPTAGLDPVLTDDIGKILKDFNKKGKTSIMVTHDEALAIKISHRIAIIYQNTIYKILTPIEIKEIIKEERDPTIKKFFVR